MYERIRADIDLNAAIDNMEAMKKLLHEDTKMYAVIKADGYGHGAIPIAHAIEDLSYLQGFCVATVDEGIALREAGIKKQILILGFTFPSEAVDIVKYSLTPAVFTTDMAKILSDAAVKSDTTLTVHLKIDTGMGRIGIQPDEEGIRIAKEIASLPNIEIEAAFTHFAKADELDKTHVQGQIACFHEVSNLLSEAGIKIPYYHCSNSASIIDLPQANMDFVRAGITLYGLWPSDEVIKERIQLKPLMSLKSHVSHVKIIKAGQSISYGGTFVASKDTKIATIPVGYADGYPRSLSNRGFVLIYGKKAPICGRVCMDQFMVDVSDIEGVTVGTEVTLLGIEGTNSITMEDLGALSGRFNYELACDIGKRVPRIYHLNQNIVHTSKYNSF